MRDTRQKGDTESKHSNGKNRNATQKQKNQRRHQQPKQQEIKQHHKMTRHKNLTATVQITKNPIIKDVSKDSDQIRGQDFTHLHHKNTYASPII